MNNIKIISIIITLLIINSFTIFAQNTVKGIVKDSQSKEVMPFANVMIYNTDETKLITYTVTNQDGGYKLNIANGTYTFKVSFLGYNTLSVKKNISGNLTLDFKIKPQDDELKEVVIEGKAIDLVIKDDTVRYNLKSLTTGNEATLKDILKKLPGIEIDENGKIKANGKKIDKLLIDGKEFFGDQHQLATENISSEMVDGVALLNNFKDFDNLNPDAKSAKTAMNIEIKDEYRGKIKGNITLTGGYKNKYEVISNLYTFTTKLNFFLIASGNNIGKQTFSFLDYINFQGGISKFMGGQTTRRIEGDDLPSFLFTNNKIKSKEEQIIALNASYQASKKFKINSYIIFNRSNTKEEELMKQTYLTNNKELTRNVNHSSDNTFLVNNSFLDIYYKPNPTSSFNYSANFSPQKSDESEDDALINQSFNSKYNNINYSFNQILNYKQKIKKFFFDANLYHEIKNKDKNLNILSDKQFLDLLFTNNLFSAQQDINQSLNNYGLRTSLSGRLFNNLSFFLTYNISKSKEIFKTDISNNSLQNNIKLNTLEHLAGISFNNGSKTLILYRFGANYNFLDMQEGKIEDILPFANIKFNFSSRHYLDLSYNKTITTPSIENIINNPYISDFNSFIANQDIFRNTSTKEHQFHLKYSIYDEFSGTLLELDGKYNIKKNKITKNTVSVKDYYTSLYKLADKYDDWFTEVVFNKNFSAIPLRLNLWSYYMFNNNEQFIENHPIDFEYEKFFYEIKFSSKFRTWFNFEAGYSFKQSKISNADIVTKFTISKPFTRLLFNYKQFAMTIDASYDNYKSNLLNHDFIQIDPSARYKSKNKKWEFYIKAKDILQLNKNEIINTTLYANYFTEKYISVMGGYILFGGKFMF